ncbi:hypothetical protein RWH44_06025 [Microbacterium sp. KSW2-29]|uniref:DUF4276 family protein n=1 Tax=Microbacterium phycohabitans TaxID=3075993 RepID=A0ABU3SKC2_9MICO|nr:hypothetical protein [Microbacterium sp. KSW2-29]MDU0345257.1 hypothetical protein [Microbacterium sp. KSW2-29]
MINIAVEGESDREAAKAVVRAAGQVVGKIRVAGGKTRLDPLIPKYNAASSREPWVVFRDSDSACPVALRSKLLAEEIDWRSTFSLRIAHSMTEAWLLADREMFASYFAVPIAKIPTDPELVPHAKRTLLSLVATSSKSRDVRRDMVVGSDETGPLFVSRINEFAATMWRPAVAGESSESLSRAIARIAALESSI